MTPVTNTSAPPVQNTSDTDKEFATNEAKKIILYCSDAKGKYDPDRLRKLVEMIIENVNEETGVMPSVGKTPATSNPPSNNPIDPSEWDWSQWEKKHLKTPAGMREVGFIKRRTICTILGKSLENSVEKTNAILEHSMFKNSTKAVLDSATVTCTVHRAKTCDKIVDELFHQYQARQTFFSPTGMIKAAISLGYLTRQDMEVLYNMR